MAESKSLDEQLANAPFDKDYEDKGNGGTFSTRNVQLLSEKLIGLKNAGTLGFIETDTLEVAKQKLGILLLKAVNNNLPLE